MDKVLQGLNGLFPVVIILLSLIFVRMFLTIFHEAGHAIAMALLTKGKVVIFLGSYGNREESFSFRLGNFEIWIIKNILKWKGGLCIPQASEVSIRKKIIYILAGPLASLLLMLLILCLYLYYRPEGIVAPFLIIFCIAAGLSFLYNIVPGYAAIVTSKGNLTYNDGAQIEKLLNVRKLPGAYHEAIADINQGRFKEGAALLENIIDRGTKNADIYRKAIAACMELKNYTKANEIQKRQIEKIGNLNSHDRMNVALLKVGLGKYEDAIAYYKHLLQMNEGNKYNLNNFGYTLTIVERFEEAIPYLDKAILTDQHFANAYNNKGYAKMKIGFIEDGKADIEYSLKLDDKNAYAYRNLGIYFYDRGRYPEALKEFEKARELDADTLLLDKYLIETSNRVADV